jgi:ubiquinone/menaquinone biosynthesis C-methylase UbiE
MAAPEPGWRALDVATGTGHTAFALAPHVAEVIATDITPEMLAEGERLRIERKIPNVGFSIADVHDLPFPDEAFDLVTCRRAAHHFSRIRIAIEEMRRLLRPGGRLVIDDRSVPDDDFVDACMNKLDWYHDESHIRQYRPQEWRKMLEDGGFAVEIMEPYIQHRPLTSLTDGVTPENVRKIEKMLARLNDEEREKLNLVERDGELYLNHWYVMLAARRL